MSVRTTKTLRLVLFAALAVTATAFVARRLSDSPPPAGEPSTGAAGQYKCPSALGGTYPPRSAYQDEFYGYVDANVYPLGPWDPGGAGGVACRAALSGAGTFRPTSPGPRFNRPPAAIMSGAPTTRWSPSSPEPQSGFNRSLSHRRPGHTPTPSHPGTRCTSLTSSCPFRAPTLAAWDDYVREVVGRYGVGGTFWSDHPELPELPMREWEVGNEPNLAANNPGYVSADRNRGIQPGSYAELLIHTAAVLRSAPGFSPTSRVLFAGLFSGRNDIGDGCRDPGVAASGPCVRSASQFIRDAYAGGRLDYPGSGGRTLAAFFDGASCIRTPAGLPHSRRPVNGVGPMTPAPPSPPRSAR